MKIRKFSPQLLEMIRCPKCASKGEGKLKEDGRSGLFCGDCNEVYEVRNGLPVLITAAGDFLKILRQKGSRNG